MVPRFDILLQTEDPSGLIFGLGVFMILVGLVALAVVILSVVVTIQAYKAGRWGWWVYLIAVFVAPFNLVAVIAWYAHLKRNPMVVDGRPFL